MCPGVRSALQHLEWDGGMEQRQIAHHLSSADKAAEIHCPQESSGSAITLRFISTIHSRSVFPPSQVTSRGCKLALSALCFPKATFNSSPFLPFPITQSVSSPLLGNHVRHQAAIWGLTLLGKFVVSLLQGSLFLSFIPGERFRLEMSVQDHAPSVSDTALWHSQ